MKTFKEKVFSIIKKIPKGKVLTYKEVARLAGRPRAWRAVGNVLNRNQEPITIPCHRVVKFDGRLGGYKYGVEKKASLLKKEGVVVKNGRVKLI